MLKIGDFSRLARVTVKALRLYGRLGLLKPAWIDRFTGYRYYAPEQLPRLNRILALKDLGFSLEQIRDLLQRDLPPAELRGMLELKRAELERQVRAEQARIARIEARLRQIEREGAAPRYEVALKTVEPQRVLGIRDALPGWADVPRLIAELCATVQAQGIAPQSMQPYLTICYDAEYRERRVDVEAATMLSFGRPGDPAPLSDAGRARVHLLDGAPQAACSVHQGSYESLIEAYEALNAWMQANGCRALGPSREVYLQGPQPGVAPAQYVTEIQVPVADARDLPAAREKETQMEPQIVTQPAFTLVGMRYYGKNEHDEIKQLWAQANPRMAEIRPRAGTDCYGACWQPDESGAFEYVAGIAVEPGAEAPEGMVRREIPASRYAVFPTTLKEIGATYKHAFETWLPASGYEWGRTPDFELYDDTFDPDNVDESRFYIYIPIK